MEDPHVDTLARFLETLGSPVRLEILRAARVPVPPAEIRISAAREHAGRRPERPLSRQTIAHHVEQLEQAGLLERVPTADGREAIVVNHPRLFAIVDAMRALTKLRAVAELPAGATVAREESPHRLPPPPRLLVAFGRDDGVAFPLRDAAAWAIGRAEGSAIRLDYDPYVSADHAVIERSREGFVLRDVGSRNGTWVDWERVVPGAGRPLRSGAVLVLGRSVLVFQEAD